MELMEAIAKRRTVRDFLETEIPMEVIQKAFSAGLKAPTYNHMREWDFILVNDQRTRYRLTQTEEMIEQLDEEILQLFEREEPIQKEMYLDAIPKQKKMIIQAPGLFVMVYKPKTQVADSKRIYDLNCLASVWCCLENILLSFAEDDVFGVTFIPKNTGKVKEVLGVPAELEVAAIVPFGYKDNGCRELKQNNIALEDRLHIDQW